MRMSVNGEVWFCEVLCDLFADFVTPIDSGGLRVTYAKRGRCEAEVYPEGVGTGGEYRIINNNSLCDSFRRKQNLPCLLSMFLCLHLHIKPVSYHSSSQEVGSG
jgi:hypothetical protein